MSWRLTKAKLEPSLIKSFPIIPASRAPTIQTATQTYIWLISQLPPPPTPNSGPLKKCQGHLSLWKVDHKSTTTETTDLEFQAKFEAFPNPKVAIKKTKQTPLHWSVAELAPHIFTAQMITYARIALHLTHYWAPMRLYSAATLHTNYEEFNTKNLLIFTSFIF